MTNTDVVLKKCTKCKVIKPVSDFTWNKGPGPTGGFYMGRCKSCNAEIARNRHRSRRHTAESAVIAFSMSAEQSAKWRANHPDLVAERQRWYYVKHRYGITRDQYEEMYQMQGGVCAIAGCGRPVHSIDHDHACCPHQSKGCGECVRGLLCHDCNLMIGMAAEDVARLQGAIDYLVQWRDKKDIHHA